MTHDTACQQGAQCNRQTVAAFDTNETQCQIPVSFYTNCHRILWHGGVQDMHREIQGTSVKHSRQRLHRQQEVNKKYAFMSRHGGPGAWTFIPYIFSHIPVKKQIPLTLESQEIQLYPKHLNKRQFLFCAIRFLAVAAWMSGETGQGLGVVFHSTGGFDQYPCDSRIGGNPTCPAIATDAHASRPAIPRGGRQRTWHSD